MQGAADVAEVRRPHVHRTDTGRGAHPGRVVVVGDGRPPFGRCLPVAQPAITGQARGEATTYQLHTAPKEHLWTRLPASTT